MSNQTKISKIKKHLILTKSITSLEAIQYFWHTRVADVIYKLKKQGWVFDTQYPTNKSGTRYAVYHLISHP